MSRKSYAFTHDLELRAAIVATAAVLLSFGSGLLLENAAHLNVDAPLIAVVLALTLARTQRGADLRGRLIGLVVLPLTAVAASEIGNLMLHHPNYGDTLFALAVSLSIWLRRFGQRATKAGTLLALPFVGAKRRNEISSAQLDPLREAGFVSRTENGWRLTAAGRR